MTWRLRHQLIALAVFGSILVLGFLSFNYVFGPEPTCFDGKQNQDETGPDCGGLQCLACITEVRKDVIILWTRLFEVRPGAYEAGALVENPNVSLGARAVPYTMKFVDEEGLVIATRRGETYVLPQSRLLIFEGNVVSQLRKPKRVLLELESPTWELIQKQELPLRIIKGESTLGSERPRYDVTLKNESIDDIYGVDASLIVYAPDGNALGVSVLSVDTIADTASVELTFTWPQAFLGGHSVGTVETIVQRNPWSKR